MKEREKEFFNRLHRLCNEFNAYLPADAAKDNPQAGVVVLFSGGPVFEHVGVGPLGWECDLHCRAPHFTGSG